MKDETIEATDRITVEVYTDPAPFQKTLSELSALAKTSQAPLEVIQRFFNSASQVELVDFEQKVAVGTSNLVLVIKPSDKLLEFMTAIRTGKSKFFTANIK